MPLDENAPDEATRPEKNYTKLLTVLALCSFFVGIDLSLTLPLIPAIAESTGASIHLGQLLVSAYAFAVMITAPIFGAVSDTWGRKKVILIGMLILAIGTFLTGIGNSFSMLLVFRALTGIGAGMITPGVYAIIGDTLSYDRRGQAMGIANGALLSATLFGPPISGYITVFTTWRWAFWVAAGGAAVMVIVIYSYLPTSTPPTGDIAPLTAVGDQFRTTISTPIVLFALVAMFLFFGGSEGIIANVSIFFDLVYGLDSGQTGLVFLLIGGMSAIGSIVGGRIADHVGKKPTIGASCVLGGVGILGLTMSTQNIVIAIGMAVLWTVGFGTGHTVLTALLSELDPDIRGTVLALENSAMYAGNFAFTAASAALLEWEGFFLVGIICGGAMVAALPIVWYRVEEHTDGEPKTEPSAPTADMD